MGVSRWEGLGRGPKKPKAKAMEGPSPVICLATLASSVAAAHENGNVFIWDTTGRTAVPLHQFEAHRVPIGSMAVLTSLGCLVTAGTAKNREEAVSESLLKLWGCSTFELR